MKKFLLILVVVFASCASPVDEPDVVGSVNPFEGRWLDTKYNKIVEFRDNTWSDPYNSFTYEYDDTYIYQWMPGNLSHIYITFRYEFRDGGNELHLYWVDNVYGAYPGDDHFILQKIGD